MTRTAGFPTDKVLRGQVRRLQKAGCIVAWGDGGTVDVRDPDNGGKHVLKGLQHPAGYWIVRYFNSERIRWSW